MHAVVVEVGAVDLLAGHKCNGRGVRGKGEEGAGRLQAWLRNEKCVCRRCAKLRSLMGTARR